MRQRVPKHLHTMTVSSVGDRKASEERKIVMRWYRKKEKRKKGRRGYLTAICTIYISYYILYAYECLCSRSSSNRRAPPPTCPCSVSCFRRFCSVTIYFFIFIILRLPATGTCNIPCNNDIILYLLLYIFYISVNHYSLS